MLDLKGELKARAGRVNDALAGLTANKPGGAAPRLWEAMTYSLNLGGKRLRPLLVLEGARLAGVGEQDAMPLALAFEMAHTASLIHDDLPAMDNDDLRRGKPSNHKMFGDGLAILAGDSLMVYGFQLVLQSPSALSTVARTKALEYFSVALGPQGICSGQTYDIDPVSRGEGVEFVTLLATQKTARLIQYSLMAGAALGQAEAVTMSALSTYGEALGLAFQVADDLLDVLGDQTLLGKTVGKDAEQDKMTFTALLGLEGAKELLERLTQQAVQSLVSVKDNEFLRSFALYLRDRVC